MPNTARIQSFLKPHKSLLVIPFSVNENNFTLYMRAMDWRNSLRANQRLDKLPGILCYRRDDESDDDYIDHENVQFAFTPENTPPGTNIYILADGFGDKEFIGNTNFMLHDQEDFYMPMQLVAKRLQAMGLTPELAAQAKLKLYVCNEKKDSTLNLAKKLGQSLGEAYSDLTIYYYTTTLFTPDLETGVKKTVVKIESPEPVIITENGHSETYKQVFYMTGGKPKNFRGQTSVLETLLTPSEPSSNEANLATQSNRAISEVDLPLKAAELFPEKRENTIVTFYKSPPVTSDDKPKLSSNEVNKGFGGRCLR